MPVLSPEEFERIDKLLATRRPTTPVTPAPVAEESIPISQYPAEILKGAISGSTAELADLALRKGLDSNILDPATEGWGPYHVGYGLGALLGGPARLATGAVGLTARAIPRVSPWIQAAVAGGLANAPVSAISAAVQDEDILPATVRGGVLGAGIGAAGSKLEPLLKHYFGRVAPSYTAQAADEAVPPGTPPPVTETVAGLPPRTPPPEVTPPTGPRPTPTPRETFAEAQARAQETLANAPPVPPLQRPFGPTRMPPPRTPPPETPEAPVSPTIASTRTKKGSGRTYEETVNPPPPPVPAMGLDPADLARLGEETRGQNLVKHFTGATEEGLPELPTQSFAQSAANKIGAFMDTQFPDSVENGVQVSNAAERDWVRNYVTAVTTGQKPPKVTVDPFFKKLADDQLKDLRVSLKQQAETPRTQSGLGTRAVPTATVPVLAPAPEQMTMPPTPVRLTNVVSQGLAPGGEAFEHPAVSGIFGMPPTQAAVQYGARAPIPPPAPEDAFRLPAAQTLWGGAVVPEPLPEPLPPVTYTPRAVPTATKPQPLPEPTPLPVAAPAFEPLPLPEEDLPPLPLPEAATPLPVTPEPVVTPKLIQQEEQFSGPWRSSPRPVVEPAPVVTPEPVVPPKPVMADEEKLYEQAKKLIAKEEQVSRTLLQRRMKIGFDRAEGILNRMEQEGLVSAPLKGEHIGVPRQVLTSRAGVPATKKKVDLTKAATLPIETTEPIKAALEALNPIRKELGVAQKWQLPLSSQQMLKRLQREQEEGTVEGRLEEAITPFLSFADVPGLTERLGKPYGPLIDTLIKNWEKASTSFDPTAYRQSLAQKEITPAIRKLLTTEGQEAKKERAAITLATKLREQLGIEGAETKAGVIAAGPFAGLSSVEKEAPLLGSKIGSEATAEISQAIEQLVGPERAQQLVQLVNTATDDKTLISRATALFKTALPAAIAAAGVTALQPDVAQAIQQEAPKLQNDPAATYLKLNDMGHTDLTMEDVEQALHTQVSPAKKKAVRKLTPQAKKTYLDLTTTEEDMAA